MNYEYRCKHCNRFLNVIVEKSIEATIICPSSACRGGTHLKVEKNNPYILVKEIKPKEHNHGKDNKETGKD